MYEIVLIIAVLQIILEMAPVSSSGHVTLFKKYAISYGHLPKDWIMPEWFEYILNIPALLVILVFFRQEVGSFVQYILLIIRTYLKTKKVRFIHQKWLILIGKVILFVLVADLITAIPFFICKKIFTCGVTDAQQIVGFIVTAMSLFFLRVPFFKCMGNPAVIFGIAQGGAKLFSCSRFGSTIAAGHFLGFTFRRSLQASFLMYVPLLFATSCQALLSMPVSVCIRFFDVYFFITILFATIVGYITFYGMWVLGQRQWLWKLGFYMLIPLLALIFL